MKTLILILLFTMFLTMGCATQEVSRKTWPIEGLLFPSDWDKEAIQKGYITFDKKEAITGGILNTINAALLLPPSGSLGYSYNLILMEQNYPECFLDEEGKKSPWVLKSLECIRNKVKEEGSWR